MSGQDNSLRTFATWSKPTERVDNKPLAQYSEIEREELHKEQVRIRAEHAQANEAYLEACQELERKAYNAVQEKIRERQALEAELRHLEQQEAEKIKAENNECMSAAINGVVIAGVSYGAGYFLGRMFRN